MTCSDAPFNNGGRARRGHAVRDLESRRLKGMKIAGLLGAIPTSSSRRMLEIGTGSGGIAHYFGARGVLKWDVHSVDVEDVREVKEGFHFTKVEGVELPFEDATFDVVVSNHVIEHVGNGTAQLDHLREMARVLRPDGVCYLAVPNRWMLVEPHFKLPFLSWLPSSLADAYVRFAGKGEYYDCRPLTVSWLESRFAIVGFSFAQHHEDALRLTYELEHENSLLYRCLLKPVPGKLYRVLRRAFPTLIYTLWPAELGGQGHGCRAHS